MASEKQYYLVNVVAAGASKQGQFTYDYDQKLAPGQLVYILLFNRASLGIVEKTVGKPRFKTKPISSVVPLPVLPISTLELAAWIASYYATGIGQVWRTILPHQPYVGKPRVEVARHAKMAKPAELKLTAEQLSAIKAIRAAHQPVLLHGATGSGKTQVYIELAKEALDSGKSSIILVPEIALTPQMIDMLSAYFGSNLILTHSRMTPAHRRVAWQQALEAETPKIVVGPRSALFLPLNNLCLIIIDEAHDGSYKQDQAPRYNTGSVAAYLSKLTGATLVLGTATPNVNDLYLASANRLKLVAMPTPVFKSNRSPTIIIDLKQKEHLTHSYLISKQLLSALKTTLAAKKQAILFLNRRGSARVLLCRHCGWIATCPNCQIPLTWHAEAGKLICHWCNFNDSPPAACPNCGNLDLRFLSGGTERVEQELKRLLPDARVARLDRDSVELKDLEGLYRRLQKGEIDILIGTQMVTKGLDLPNVETIGILLADTMLYLPDYTAAERTFQLLYQVSGRAGRRDQALANVIIQTYSPNHPAITAAATGNYKNFVEEELAERKTLNYPPFTHLLKLTITKPSRKAAENSGQKLADELTKKKSQFDKSLQIVGPAPAWQETYGGKYHWQLIVKSKIRADLVKVASNLPTDWIHDLDPTDLL